MKQNRIIVLLSMLAFAGLVILAFVPKEKMDDDRFVTYIINAKKQNVELFWKDDKNELFRSIRNLQYWLRKNKRKLLFAMNAGMYRTDNTPQGLYIENQKILFPADTSTGAGNFYLKPNGVFYITKDNVPFICSTTQFAGSKKN